MTDQIDFRISEKLAIGHDPLNVIIFRRKGIAKARELNFDGDAWQAVQFIYRDKAVLLRCLREMGLQAPERHATLAAMPADLRDYRAACETAGAYVSAA